MDGNAMHQQDSSDENREALPRIAVFPNDAQAPPPGSADSINKRMMIHQSEEMQQLIEQAKSYADNSASILVTGESGTGKELLCRFIHEQSGRAPQKFVAVNCAAIPEMLVESEFFGHSRGAFTGAVEQRMGHFERAHEGTILLDEISEIPLTIQSKLLRVLEEKEVQRLGSNECKKIDVRVIATSNRDLESEVAQGRFRLDLYHRLNILGLQIPPLRERTADIPVLVQHFIQLFRPDRDQVAKGITETALRQLLEHAWPGNVRELRNLIHRACILCRQNLISTDCFGSFAQRKPAVGELASLRGKTIGEVERLLILDSLKRFAGDKRAVAEELGVTTRTLNNKLKRYRESGATIEIDSPTVAKAA